MLWFFYLTIQEGFFFNFLEPLFQYIRKRLINISVHYINSKTEGIMNRNHKRKNEHKQNTSGHSGINVIRHL